MKKSRIYIYATALICAFLLLFLVGCAIGEKPIGAGNEETSDVVVESESNGSAETESAGASDTAGTTDAETKTESETESETKNYGMGFVPV